MNYGKSHVEFFREHLKTDGGVEVFIKHLLQYGQQNVHTPFDLCQEIIGKLAEYVPLKKKQIAVLFNLEFLHVLVRKFGVPQENVTMFADDKREFEFCKNMYPGVHTVLLDVEKTIQEKKLYTMEGEVMKRFDIIVSNPPFQAPSKNNNKGAGNTLWNKFVEKSFSLVEDGGYVCLVHPSGWRNVGGRFKQCQQTLRSKQVLYLEIHNADDGLKTFGAGTRYDWYVAQNLPPTRKTLILGEDGDLHKVDLSTLSFIPNGRLEEIANLIGTAEKDRIKFLYDCGYHSCNGPVSKIKNDEFRFPCVQHVSSKNNEPSCLYYSNTNKKGHFGIPKVIFGAQISGVLVDKEGKFGMCEHCAAIIDDVKNLELIQKAMTSNKFIELMKMCDVGGNRDRFNRKIISLFRKDFWKEFI